MSRALSIFLFFSIILTVGILVLFHILLLSRLAVSAAHWLPSGQIATVESRVSRPLVACGHDHGIVNAETRFAIVSIMSGAFSLYGLRSVPLQPCATQPRA